MWFIQLKRTGKESFKEEHKKKKWCTCKKTFCTAWENESCIHVLVTGIGMKRANCKKCLGVEINEFLTWDTDNERKRVFCFVLSFWIVNFITWIVLLAAYEKRFNAISCVVCRFPIKNYDLGQVQPPLHLCAEPNWWIKSGKRAASESVSP